MSSSLTLVTHSKLAHRTLRAIPKISMNKIIPVAIAIIHKENRFLLTERKGNDPDEMQFCTVWHYPGGQVEFGETVEEALHREIKEELNLDILIEKQLGSVYSAIRPLWQGILIPYICKIVGKEEIKLDHESLNVGWYTFEEINVLKKLPFVQEMTDTAIKLL